MSTSPTPQLPEQSPVPPPPRGRSTLAKTAIALAAIIVLTFGLCSVMLISSTKAISGPVFTAAIIIEAICIVALIVVGILAIARRSRPN
jgi:hypothetical protein